MRTNDLFMSAAEISMITGMSEAYAYKIIKQLNKELQEKGFMTIRGRVSKDYFQERIYGAKEVK
ncbi:MAG: DNA-binding protein [Erysipelotrichaceae bacterium]|nr:DNA-binding protein [Erysipelotrichaceae bacterium]